MTPKKASNAQLKMIYGLAKRAGIDSDILHTITARVCHRDSLAALTSFEASRLIDHLKRYLGEADEGAGRATEKQRGKIYALARAMGWMDNPRRLRSFLEVRYKVSDVRFLSHEQAGLVIEALKAMEKGGRAERSVARE